MSLISGKSKNLSFAACEPFFAGYAKSSNHKLRKDRMNPKKALLFCFFPTKKHYCRAYKIIEGAPFDIWKIAHIF